MGVVFYKVYWTSKETGVEEDITDALDMSVLKALEAKSTTAELHFKNTRQANSSTRKYTDAADGWLSIESEDSIMVYADRTEITRSATQLLISGDVKEVSQEYSEEGAILNVSIVDKTYKMLSTIPAKRKWSSQKPYTIVKDIVRQSARNTSGEYSMTDSKNKSHNYDVEAVLDTTSGGYIQTTHPNGGDFNPISFTGSLQNAYEMIREISQAEYCQDSSANPSPRGFIFWIDNENKFHWVYPDDRSNDYDDSSLSIYSTEFNSDTYGVVNMYIFDCGLDFNDYHIYWYAFNEANPGGDLKMKFMPMVDISKTMRQDEEERMAEYGNLDANDDGLPDSYPYVTSWGVSTSSDSDYNEAFRDEAMDRGENRARGFFKGIGETKLKGQLEIKGTNDYTVGKIISITDSSFGLSSKYLRIKEVNHTIGKEGWFTTIVLEEDESLIVPFS